jgi:hypothetical protein
VAIVNIMGLHKIGSYFSLSGLAAWMMSCTTEQKMFVLKTYLVTLHKTDSFF